MRKSNGRINQDLTANNLEGFLTRQGDKELMADIINNIKNHVNEVKNIDTNI